MHGSLGCPICGASNIALGAASCPGCGVAFAAPAPPVQQPSAAATAIRPAPALAPTPTTWAAAPAATPAVQYAEVWRRFLAFVIDSVVVATPFIMLQGWEAYFRTPPAGLSVTLDLGTTAETLAALVYISAMQSSSWQATLGMRVVGIQLVDEDQLGRVGFARAAGRYLASFLSALLLMVGFLMMCFTKRRQALHDILARTLVVRDGR